MNKKSRRHTLKTLALGTSVVWVKPVVNSVLLPAHASLTFLDSLECTQASSIFVDDGGIPTCGSIVQFDEDLSALFALGLPDPGPGVEMVGLVLCNGEVIELNPFNSSEGLGTNLNPEQLGCTSGTITIRLYRLDTGCSAECSWNVADPG